MKLTLAVVVVMFGFTATAQSVLEAKKFLFNGRHHLAKSTLEKIIETTPANSEAIYWLSQVLFENKKHADAVALLRKSMEGAKGSDPLLLVAMGQAELIEKKPNDARQRFETAISLTKAKNAMVFVAIGKANLEQGGDPAYGIEKLKQAATIKGFNEPIAYVYMGDLYRKLNDGGGAVSSYENALMLDPKLAIAKHKIGKVYLTQGNEQKDIFLGKFNDAVADEPTFIPALYDMYVYYYTRDVIKARSFFNLYKQHAEPGPALDYEEASLNFAAADFKTAIQKADDLLTSQGDKADVRLYRLKGYSFDKLGDSVNALAMMETFFQKATPDEINPDNYVIAAFNAAKVKSDPAKVNDYFTKAIDSDTAVANKVDYTKRAAEFFKKSGNVAKSAEWLTKVLSIAPKLSKVDLYNAGFENFKSAQYVRADSIFSVYKTNFPNEVYGHYWSFRSLSVIDSTMELGLALKDCENFIAIAESDKVKNKSTLITAYGYLAGYAANIKKDLPAAITYLDKIIEIDPNNQDAISNKEIIAKALVAPKK
jgi:tetratricopeptide (TPR) repeat protein